jgi:sugar lactone lactonase YvrE
VRLAATLTAAALAAVTLVDAPAGARPTAKQSPQTIALPDGWQPEGITTDGRELYAGSLADGAIWQADPRTGKGSVLAPGAEGRVAVGIDHDRRRDVLWVAGGPTAEVRAQDADTGAVLATYSFPGTNRFLNDVTVTRDGVYVTDSNNQELAVVPLGPGRALPPASAATTRPLTGDLVYGEGFNLNGIVSVGRWLLAVQSNTGLLFRIDPATGTTTRVDLGGYSLTNGDGLELGTVGRTVQLFVVRNRLNLVADLRLDRSLTRGTLARELTDSDFDVPTTVAEVRGALYAVNARFGTPPTPETEYDVVRVGLR